MAPLAQHPIKYQRLFLAVVITFMLADAVPHPKLGPSLIHLGWHRLGSWVQQISHRAPQTAQELPLPRKLAHTVTQ